MSRNKCRMLNSITQHKHVICIPTPSGEFMSLRLEVFVVVVVVVVVVVLLMLDHRITSHAFQLPANVFQCSHGTM